MARSSDFENNFTDNSLNGGAWQPMSGVTDVGPANNMLTIFNNDNPTGDSNNVSGGKYIIPSSLTGSERVGDFQFSMKVFMSRSPYAPHGNKLPDGLSFSFGDADSYRENPWRQDTFDYEQGVTKGLSIGIIPYDSSSAQGRGNLVVFWNGVVIGTMPFDGKGDYNSFGVSEFGRVLSVAVTETGEVTVLLDAHEIVTTIPNNEWQTVDQSGWDFAVAGRTGANGGHAYVDDIRIKSEILICFAAGTLLDCEDGPRKVESLKVGDLVMTRDAGLQPIRWIGRRKLTADYLALKPAHRPIRVLAGALGKGRPSCDLLVSPQHRILVNSAIAERMFGTSEVLVAAKQLCMIEGISVAEDVTEVEYFHIMLDGHQIVTSNGAPSESLYAGKQVLTGLSTSAIAEILSLFPELSQTGADAPPARYLPSGREARNLARRHAANHKPLLAAER